MSNRYCRGTSRFVAAICVMMAVTSTRAHLMVEQHGTVNFANGGAFLVLSVPVSAFDGVDDNDDRALSAEELRRHTAEVEQRISITATRDGKSHKMVFTPDREFHTLFSNLNLLK